MDLSVVVPTLNGRTQLRRCLDALGEHAPEAEVVVVNGPSTDGTTGTVRERAEVDVLVEIADRNPNAARNAGLEHARGEWVAFVSDEYAIEAAWYDAVAEATGTDGAADRGSSRLAGALPDSLLGAGTTVADATRGITDRSKRLAARARAGDGTDDTPDGDTPIDDTPADDTLPNETSADETPTNEAPTSETPAEDSTRTEDGSIGEGSSHDDAEGAGPAAPGEEGTGSEAGEGVDGISEYDGSGGNGGIEDRSTDGSAPTDRDERANDPPAVLTGPIRRELNGETTQSPESRTVAGRSITYFNPHNVAFRREALDATDGFDEHLQVGGARDLAHRLAAGEHVVSWHGEMCVRGEYDADGTGRDPRWDARSLSYRLVKNYGLRPAVARRIAERVTGDGLSGARNAIQGDLALSQWLGAARDVLVGTVLGIVDGLRARWRDRERRNPNGRSSRSDRAVRVYDQR
jgi:hypothetical protein